MNVKLSNHWWTSLSAMLFLQLVTRNALDSSSQGIDQQRLVHDFLDLKTTLSPKSVCWLTTEDRDAWLDQVIVNIAGEAGSFSSDRTIAQYNEDIWHLN